MSELFYAQGIRKTFGARRVLDIGEVAFAAGASYVITGDNGAGKSTLLRLLAGLEAGEVAQCRFADKTVQVQHYPDWLRQQIVYIHQHPYLFHTTLAHNVGYGLQVRGVMKREREAAVRLALEWAGLTHLAQVPPDKLSGGEKQRVALVRAKVLNPKLFLLDEPTANLDAAARKQVMELIVELADDNVCVVVACHDRELIALPHMQRLHLQDGKLESA